MNKTQTPRMPRWLVLTLLAGLASIIVLLPFHAFFSTWGGTAIGPLWLWKSWKELLLVGLTLVALGWTALRPEALRYLIKQPLVLILLGYIIWSFIITALHWKTIGSDAAAAGLAMNLRYLMAAAVAYLVFCFGGVSDKWQKHAELYLVVIGLIVAVLGIVQVALLPADFLSRFGYDKATTIAPASLIDNNPEQLRAFATLRGPNDFGAFLILPILLLAARYKTYPNWFIGAAGLVMLVALALSGSRSAVAGLVVAILVYGGVRLGRQLSPRHVGAVVVSVIFLGLLSVYASLNVPVVRTAIFHSSPGDPTLTEGSTDNHLAATLGGVERVIANPLGCGVGCAGPASYYGDTPAISENYFVQIAEETGIIGTGLFLSLVGTVAAGLYRAKKQRGLAQVLLAALMGYLVIGLLLHVWSDDPLSITWWLLTGAVLGYNEKNSWIKSKTN